MIIYLMQLSLRVKLTANYYKDAVDFVEAVQHGTDVISGLLFSKNRNEAIDAMDFFCRCVRS